MNGMHALIDFSPASVYTIIHREYEGYGVQRQAVVWPAADPTAFWYLAPLREHERTQQQYVSYGCTRTIGKLMGYL